MTAQCSAVSISSSRLLITARYEHRSKNSRQSTRLSLVDQCSDVRPALSARATSAPILRSSFIDSRHPRQADHISGVFPLSSRALTFALTFTRALHAFGRFPITAYIRGVRPEPSSSSTDNSDSSARMAPSSPRAAAMCSGDELSSAYSSNEPPPPCCKPYARLVSELSLRIELTLRRELQIRDLERDERSDVTDDDDDRRSRPLAADPGRWFPPPFSSS
mmetsp:Transcript_9403/g.24246  ORF Transcript_9403/g.24246 Transcript_9403/m.24246 type:complete len:220 (-) Transcript_9403:475-1134(-)